MRHRRILLLPALALLLAVPPVAPLAAQHQPHHPPPQTPAEEKPAERPEQPAAEPMEHAEHAAAGHELHAMPAFLGPYLVTRESSGTAWQPESAPHQGRHLSQSPWHLMLHAQGSLVYDDQDGPRGDQDTFSSNMVMLMGSRPAGRGRLGLRAMLSAEPWTIGDEGYPLLLQTGETADGRTPLVDRQHPHDLFMELAATYSRPLGEDGSVFVYLGLPGEPALGPPAFPHRFSAWENPAAPLAHHWQDSTHIAFGVATLGVTRGPWKLEGSLFTGREPDQHRTDVEDPKMDSWSLRASWQPVPNWSLQASFARLESPEQLEPAVDVDRTTISAIHNRPLPDGTWQTTFVWGRNAADPGDTTDAFLLESAYTRARHTIFGRAEHLENGELFGHGDPRRLEDVTSQELRIGGVFEVGEVTLGYLYDPWLHDTWRAGIGALATLSLIPSDLEPIYGTSPRSWMTFLRLRL
jgi:hypothetical protein